jgi:hypothetical protein
MNFFTPCRAVCVAALPSQWWRIIGSSFQLTSANLKFSRDRSLSRLCVAKKQLILAKGQKKTGLQARFNQK